MNATMGSQILGNYAPMVNFISVRSLFDIANIHEF